jgi:hypothetical protein
MEEVFDGDMMISIPSNMHVKYNNFSASDRYDTYFPKAYFMLTPQPDSIHAKNNMIL